MSAEERKIESILLKERRNLINCGTEGKHIKIRGNGLYVHRKLYAAVQNFQLCLLSSPQLQTNVTNANSPTIHPQARNSKSSKSSDTTDNDATVLMDSTSN